MKKIFIDTNYILRLVLHDQEKQYLQVKKVFDEAIDKKVNLFTSIIVIFEVYWVLTSVYEQSKEDCIHTLENLLRLHCLEIPERMLLQKALAIHKKSSLSLEDGYNIAYQTQYEDSVFVTFDKKLLNYLKKYT